MDLLYCSSVSLVYNVQPSVSTDKLNHFWVVENAIAVNCRLFTFHCMLDLTPCLPVCTQCACIVKIDIVKYSVFSVYGKNVYYCGECTLHRDHKILQPLHRLIL